MEKLIYQRHGRKFTVRGYNEEGTISTAFDMTVMNEVDRFHLVIDVCDKIEHEIFDDLSEEIKYSAVYLRQEMKSMLNKHRKFINEFGCDMEEITSWKWDL